MLTEEDFEKAEEAIKVVDDSYNNSQLFAPSLSVADKTLYDFAKKVLAQSRRDFLTEPNDLESRVKSLENKFEQVKVVFMARGTPTIPKITPMK